jgi:hypothetical protein
MTNRIHSLMNLIRRERANLDAEPVKPTKADIRDLALAIHALCVALFVDPYDTGLSMLDLARDNVMREPASTKNDLVYAYMLAMFTLFDFNDDDYDLLINRLKSI